MADVAGSSQREQAGTSADIQYVVVRPQVRQLDDPVSQP